METVADNYVRFYKLQSGGRLPVFYGQEGEGIGDVLKGAMGKLMPYVFPGVKGSVNEMMDSAEKLFKEGKSAKQIMKTSALAGLKGGFTAAKDKFLDDTFPIAPTQSGTGRRRKRKHTTQKGGGKRRKRARIGGKRRRLYKKPKRKSSKRRSRKGFRKLPFKTNF